MLSDFSIILRVARFLLPHLSGLPHLPGASLLYVKRPLVIDYIAEVYLSHLLIITNNQDLPRALGIHVAYGIIRILSSDAFEQHTSTASERFAVLSRDFEQMFGQIVSIRVKKT